MGKHYKKEDNKKLFFLKILRLIFFVTLIISIIYIAKWYISNKENKELKEQHSEAITVENIEVAEDVVSKEYKVDFKKLKEVNEDTVAWLKVKGTQIEYTVVQANDNSYYLNRNFEKAYNDGGWIFADYKNKFDGTDKNIVIYGHNMRDNSMFGSLKNILAKDWYDNEENYILNLITEKENIKYQVFSVYQIENEDYYIQTKFTNNEFKEFIKKLKNRSIKDFKVEVTEEDSILTLSTCANNNKYRTVLHAKKINE